MGFLTLGFACRCCCCCRQCRRCRRRHRTIVVAHNRHFGFFFFLFLLCAILTYICIYICKCMCVCVDEYKRCVYVRACCTQLQIWIDVFRIFFSFNFGSNVCLLWILLFALACCARVHLQSVQRAHTLTMPQRNVSQNNFQFYLFISEFIRHNTH